MGRRDDADGAGRRKPPHERFHYMWVVVGLFVVLTATAVARLIQEMVAAPLPEGIATWMRGYPVWIVLWLALSAFAVPFSIKMWMQLNKRRATSKVKWGPDHQVKKVVFNQPREDKLSDLDLEIHIDGEDAQSPEDVAPVIDELLTKAISVGASDVHFEPGPVEVVVRYRVDGTLVNVISLPRVLHDTIVNRLKVMSNLPPFERATPQDGRIFAQVGKRDVDIRVSFLPTINGEKCVLRILETKGDAFDLENLGMSPHIAKTFRSLLTLPQGIIFVTGPTGSGKTTTMYSSLRHIRNNSKGMVNIVSIEDPVEYVMAGFSQTQVNEDAGLTFAKGLRTILRQDPDVIMVGEIRDLETAQIAMQAGLTGHLMLTTVHSESTTGVFSRLVNMGIEPFLLSSAAAAVLSQRLVRSLCPACKEPTKISDAEARSMEQAGLEMMNDALFYTGRGCKACFGTGFRGRSLIAELLQMNESLQHLVTAKIPAREVRSAARKAGMKSLMENGLAKALNGITSLSEVLRVTR